MKTFFDGMFIERAKLEDAGIKYPIKLEYYKTTMEEENVKEKYGIEVVKTEYKNNTVNVETKEMNNLTNNEEKIDKILNLLKNNEVTPISVEDILLDLLEHWYLRSYRGLVYMY